jgi:hypothetical protein
MSAAPKAIPIRGPTTTPEIQVLLFDDELGVDVCSVECGVLAPDDATLVNVVAMLEDTGTADVAPMDALSTKRPGFDRLGSYYSIRLRLC